MNTTHDDFDMYINKSTQLKKNAKPMNKNIIMEEKKHKEQFSIEDIDKQFEEKNKEKVLKEIIENKKIENPKSKEVKENKKVIFEKENIAENKVISKENIVEHKGISKEDIILNKLSYIEETLNNLIELFPEVINKNIKDFDEMQKRFSIIEESIINKPTFNKSPKQIIIKRDETTGKIISADLVEN